MVNFIFANLVEQATVKQLENALQVIDSYEVNEQKIINIRQMIVDKISQLKPR